ncbi:MAG: hypothetical protein LBL59_07760, partial [Xanthomonadaceae bacterium]|nr:hypothetical protein [Xanthomonadaceae bacterium]
MIDFSAKDGVTPEVIENLQESIDRSPWLSGQMKMAANGPVLMGLAQPEAIGMPLRGFEVLPESAGEGASYSSYSQTIRLKLESLQRYPGRFNENDVTFLFAHEVKHHLTERESSSAKIELNQALQAVSEGPPPHDYTAPIAAYIQARAHDEAAATIAGYNALRSAVLEQHGSVDLREMYMANDGRMVDFIHADENANSYTPLPGLSFNSDLSLSETRGNIEAMAHYYFYKNLPEGYGLGHH